MMKWQKRPLSHTVEEDDEFMNDTLEDCTGISTHINVRNWSYDSKRYSKEECLNFDKNFNKNISTKEVVV